MRTSILSLALYGLFPLLGQAQAPALQSTLPAAHAVNGSRNGAVQLTFSQAVASAAAIQLHAGLSGRRAGTYSGLGTRQLSFQPNRPFAPGERVSLTVPAGVSQPPRVVEFRAAAGPASVVFSQPVAIGPPPTTQPGTVVAGDLDNDGDVDLVAGDSFGATICLNNGTGQFTPSTVALPIAPRAHYLLLADVNGDGILDLLSSGLIISSAYVNLGTGQGTFQNRVALMALNFPAQLVTGDFNADGLVDVVVGEPSGTGLRLHFCPGNASGNLAVTTTSWSTVPGRDLAAADFDEDGDLDLLMVSDAVLSACLNDGSGQFSTGATVPVTSQSAELTVGDFTGDGHVDAVCTSFNSPNLTLMPGTGAGSWQAASYVGVQSRNWHVRSADMDGDNDLDLISINDRGVVQVLLNNGRGQFGSTAAFLLGWESFTHADAADLNGDGTLDVYTGHQNTGGTNPHGFDIFFNQPLTPTAATPRTLLSFNAFPNPARGQLSLRLPEGAALVSLELHDALGRRVRTFPPAAAGRRGEYRLSLTGLRPGRYALLARSAYAQGMQWITVE